MTDTIGIKQQSQAGINVNADTTVSAEVDKVIIVGIAAFTGVVGLWSIACLASALIHAGGPVGLAVGYFKALAGM